MNKISAVICELNPQHEGHAYLFRKARENAQCLIAIMSGNIVQRGECAVFDKYKRAKSAIMAGADLVLELPFPWSSGSAAYFACGGVHLAESLGCTHLYFGSETGNVESLRLAAKTLNGSAFQIQFQNPGQAGARREELLSRLCPDIAPGQLSGANDILGVEYCRFIKNMIPVPVKRLECTGATALRASIAEKVQRSGENPEGAVLANRLATLLFDFFRCADEPPEGFAEGAGGVIRRLYKAAEEAHGGEDMFERAATKQYTNARLRRAALFAMTKTTVKMLRTPPAFTRLLAANEVGRTFLAGLRREEGNVHIVSNHRGRGRLTTEGKMQFIHAGKADSIYTLCMDPVHPAEWFASKNPVML